MAVGARMSQLTRFVAYTLLVSAGMSRLPAIAQPATTPNSQEKLAILTAAYPDMLVPGQGNDVIFKTGMRLPFDDGRGQKDFAALLSRPDIEDMFAMPYPRGQVAHPPALNADPGRIRNETFFKAMYGDCSKGEVTPNLVEIAWLPKRSQARIKVTKINGVAKRLAQVSTELVALPDRFMAYLVPSAGTYNCRTIAGTGRASAHGFGIAIDIATPRAHYWRWTKPGPDGRYAYHNAVPPEIVAIFEKHGFIWGGKWYHYDTMHFEYRPELLAASR